MQLYQTNCIWQYLKYSISTLTFFYTVQTKIRGFLWETQKEVTGSCLKNNPDQTKLQIKENQIVVQLQLLFYFRHAS